ncbi:MAG: hypothetical protein NWE84_09320 [Candidatus Bathyarchaeota archaeon]|nr:hypothetical protein [Candidatus Bathyarchaeota archaeon]
MLKLVMYGVCSRCGREFKRKPPVDLAVCDCSNPHYTDVPLNLTIEMSNRQHAKFEKIAEFTGITVEEFVNALLIETVKEKLRMLRPNFPQLVVATRR